MVQATASRRFRAPADAVFDAWLDPALARQWFAPGMGTMTRVEIDARVGGTFWLVQRRDSGEAVHTGQYLEIDRPRRLVFTWQTPPQTETARILVDITALGDDSEVTVTHEMNPEWASFIDRASAAWMKMMDAMAPLVERR
jgi:uncharacterized protein YndB with AHSA1/START domain